MSPPSKVHRSGTGVRYLKKQTNKKSLRSDAAKVVSDIGLHCRKCDCHFAEWLLTSPTLPGGWLAAARMQAHRPSLGVEEGPARGTEPGEGPPAVPPPKSAQSNQQTPPLPGQNARLESSQRQKKIKLSRRGLWKQVFSGTLRGHGPRTGCSLRHSLRVRPHRSHGLQGAHPFCSPALGTLGGAPVRPGGSRSANADPARSRGKGRSNARSGAQPA